LSDILVLFGLGKTDTFGIVIGYVVGGWDPAPAIIELDILNRLLKQWSENVNKCQPRRKQVVISLFEDGVNQHRIAEILGVS
jgi:hypothetical protein